MQFNDLIDTNKPIAIYHVKNSIAFKKYLANAIKDIKDEYLNQESFGLLKNSDYIHINEGLDVVTSTVEHIDKDVELAIDWDIIAIDISNLSDVIVYPKVAVDCIAIKPTLKKIEDMVTTWLHNIVIYVNDIVLRIKGDLVSDNGVIDYIIQHDIEFHSDGRIYA